MFSTSILLRSITSTTRPASPKLIPTSNNLLSSNFNRFHLSSPLQSFSTTMASSIPKEMKALQIHKQGGYEVLEIHTIPVPEPKEGEVLLKTEYAGVNFIDTYQRKGLYPLKLPFILGNEPSGEVAALPPNYSGPLKLNDKAASYSVGGAFAEYTIAPLSKTLKLPSSVSTKDGATAILQGLTALTLLREAHPVQEGDYILVHAAAGGVGTILCNLAKHFGCHVIGTTSTDEKAKIAKEAGAEHVILYTKENLVDRVMEITKGEGVIASYDGVGKTTFNFNFELLARKGSLVTFGNASGAVDPFPPLKLAAKNLKVCRPTLGNYIFTPEEFEKHTTELFDLISQGVVKLKVHKEYEFSAEGIKQSQEDITGRGTSGKLLIKIQ